MVPHLIQSLFTRLWSRSSSNFEVATIRQNMPLEILTRLDALLRLPYAFNAPSYPKAGVESRLSANPPSSQGRSLSRTRKCRASYACFIHSPRSQRVSGGSCSPCCLCGSNFERLLLIMVFSAPRVSRTAACDGSSNDLCQKPINQCSLWSLNSKR
jgi:hypothetical protein